MFIPATIEECNRLSWSQLDVILVTGDAYIDSSYTGVAIIGKYLIKYGYKVAIIPQPSLKDSSDILKFGIPKLFWGVTAGTVDSMVANYTALKKKRKNDDLTPNGINDKRPDRATIKYVNLIKRYCKKETPIIIGGIEASLRRLAHYDYWDNKIRKSILLDSKADLLVYGEGEKTILEIAKTLETTEGKEQIKNIRGTCYITNNINNIPENYKHLPNFDEVCNDKQNFIKMFNVFYQNNDPINAFGLIQKFGDRYVVQNPPNYYLEGNELDEVYNLNYENDVHPIHKSMGKVKGLETLLFSVTTHRGCFGECNFCAIAVHQGRKIRSRSETSVITEVEQFTYDKRFNGTVRNLGGATANMYKMECQNQIKLGSCKNQRCMFPKLCKSMDINHINHLKLIKKTLEIPTVKKVFISSGLRYDLIQYDINTGSKYLNFIVSHCVSGQMKIAPEHTESSVLDMMAKPDANLLQFVNDFYIISKQANKKQFLTYYLIAGHPGCSIKEMELMRKYLSTKMKVLPEQIQIFTPTPSTYSTLMYYTENHYSNNKKVFVEKNPQKLQAQKDKIINNSYGSNH